MRNGFQAEKKVLGFEQLESLRSKYPGKSIVFTVGCYDVLHYGHVYYLNQCAQLGDILVVGIARDSTVKFLKGKGRPVNSETERLYTISALHDVDHALLNEEMILSGKQEEYALTKVDFEHILEKLRPDVFVLGQDTIASDSKRRMCENLGIEIKVIDEKIISSEGVLSTTGLINKIKSSYP